MAASRDYTAIDIYRKAIGPLDVSPNNVAYVERFVLANLALDAVVGLFYDLVGSEYQRSAPIVAGGATGDYSTNVASAIWTASTSILSVVTMNVAFSASTHIGWMLMFRNGTNVYVGIITAVNSTTSVTLSGSNLPTADITAGNIADVLVCATPPSGNSASLAGLRIMRAGQQTLFQLESSATTQVELATPQTIFTFRTGSKANAILWAISGETILLNKGSSVTTYGTLTLRYPGVPTRMTQDSSPVDCVDAVPITLVIMKYTLLIAKRLKMAAPDYTQEMSAIINQLFANFGQQASSQVIEKKVALLKN